MTKHDRQREPGNRETCGFYFVLCVTLLNLSALAAVTVYHFQYEETQTFADKKTEIVEECRVIAREVTMSVLRDATYMFRTSDVNGRGTRAAVASDVTDRGKRAASSMGKELGALFEGLIKAELEGFAKLCSNDSDLVLCKKGDDGKTGAVGATGQIGPAGPDGQEGPMGQNGTDCTVDVVDDTPCCEQLEKPSIDATASSHTVNKVIAGRNTTLTCAVDGFPKPEVTWMFPDTANVIVNDNVIIVTNASLSETSNYTCTASSALGETSTKFQLTVNPELTFVETPDKLQFIARHLVMALNCSINPESQGTVTWFKVNNGSLEEVQDDNNTHIVDIADGSQLLVDSVVRSTAGEYVCRAQNELQTLDANATVVIAGPPYIVPPGELTVIKGQDVALFCEVIAFPEANLTWFNPPDITNTYDAKNGSLVIIAADPKDASYYTCTAMNAYGTASETLTLVVNVPPEITISPNTTGVGSGTTTFGIACEVTADKPLTVRWFKDGQKLSVDDGVMFLAGNVLLVQNGNNGDVGEYKCVAENNFGTASASSYVYLDSGGIACDAGFDICTASLCGADCPPGCSAASGANITTTPDPAAQTSVCYEAIASGALTSSGGTVLWRNEANVTLLIMPAAA